ncbi:MAG TPA: hypothetical protein VFS21_37165 [Roseiflexaceae bacterium]|nr:hypothetical protein [Roseiflexaceae bacterium]
MKLADLYKIALQGAMVSGQDRRVNLPHGGRMAVRARNGVVTLTLARRGAPVGDRELLTYRTHCGVPADAERIPAEGQRTREEGGATWHYLAYQWKQEERPAEVVGRAEGAQGDARPEVHSTAEKR